MPSSGETKGMTLLSTENSSSMEHEGADLTDKYATQILESQGRLDKYTAENDHLLDEVSNLRLQIREMKNDRAELVRAHHESMSLLAQVSEEKLVEFKSRSEQEAVESKSAQEEALRTVLEMMEKDCEERVVELDAELALVESDRDRAIELQLEAASKATEESERKIEMERAAQLAVEKLVQERQAKNEEIGHLTEREGLLRQELEMTKKIAEMEKNAAIQAEIDEKAKSESKRPAVVSRQDSQSHYVNSPFLDDSLNEMTYGRRIALKLRNFSFYQPKRPWDSNGLSLQCAWAYFEHSVLPRYILKDRKSRTSVDLDDDDWIENSNQNKASMKGGLDKAEPGEMELPTKLYSPIFTTLSDMGDFGLGVGLYFSSLRAIALISLVAGLISLPNILYFASDIYSANQPNVSFLLMGSAVCTEQVWVPCPSCSIDNFSDSRERIAGTTTVTPEGELQPLVFALKNTCDGATMNVGIVNLASVGFIVIATIALSLYQKKKVVDFDTQQQTAQDYSIEVTNPPNDATEPEEWKQFFESRFGVHTTCCTVTIDNDLLVQALAERRGVLQQVEEVIKEGATANNLSLSQHAAKVEHKRGLIGNIKSRISPGIPELVDRLTVLNQKIQGLAMQKYRATRVFCTFETESMQRDIISEMKVGIMAVYMNRVHTINPNLLFRGEIVLGVREAEEPNTIRWMDLDVSMTKKMKQLIATSIISAACIAAVAVIVALLRIHGAAYAALGISIANATFPKLAKILTNTEAHASETGKQCSLFAKIAIFRWVITAIVITIITPFTSTLTAGKNHLLQSIWLIFFADLFTSNVAQLGDLGGNFKRHFLAPRAKSQERMNLLMSGTEYTLAERFTDFTKTLFLTFYYCAIYPSIFFICSATLFINFYADKFSIMRTWKPAPMVGASIAKFSRIYFMTTSIAALALVSSYMFSGFPFDNLCADDTSHSAYYGNWQITDGNGQTTSAVVVEPNQRSYHFCNQFMGPGKSFVFPVSPKAQPDGSKWMTNPQEKLVSIYGIVSTVVLGLVGAIFVYRFFRMIQKTFSASYKPVGRDQGKSFSEVEVISAYIPQVNSGQFAYPLLAVNIDYVGESIFEWSDPSRSHSYYDMTRDVEQLLIGEENEEFCHRAFGQIRHWPPNGQDSIEVGQKLAQRSSLRRSKESAHKRNVSWSSKVTCKTYSKEIPMSNKSFNANASTNQGMNFDGHSAQASVLENENSGSPQASPRHLDFNQYQSSGIDQANQQPDPFYGDSQNQNYGHDQASDSSSASIVSADNSVEGSNSTYSEEEYSGSFSEESRTASEDSRQIL